jgi:hypothetical protein
MAVITNVFQDLKKNQQRQLFIQLLYDGCFMWFRITTRHAGDKSSVLRGEEERIVACADRKTRKISVSVKINVLNLNQTHRMPHSFVLKRTGIQFWAWR